MRPSLISDAPATAGTILIGVDWGNTHIRAFAIADDGAILGQRDCRPERTPGVPLAHAEILAALIGGWRDRHDAPPVVICGMAGARGGWVEAPYVETPASHVELARALVEVEPGVFIIPGVCRRDDGRLADAMRGEETQIVGLDSMTDDTGDEHAGDGDGRFLAVCPGTHSKWALVEGGRIAGFSTYMTGEVYALLRRHSLLAQGMDGGAPDADAFETEAFDAGVRRGLTQPTLTAALFSVRMGQIGGWLADGSADYMSGLLIGAEIAGGLADMQAARGLPLHLIGSSGLNMRYQRALKLAGCGPLTIIAAEVATARGLRRIWKETGR